MKRILTGVAAVFLLAACAPGQGPKQALGTVVGAVGGAALGNKVGKGSGRTAAIAAGALIGSMIGSQIGRELDEADRLKAEQATQGALERSRTGDVSEWSNPDSGNSGWVMPTRTWRQETGAYCREFQTGVTIGGQEETAYGTACRQPDGSWRIVQPAA